MAVIPLSQSAPNDSDAPPSQDAPSVQDHNITTQQSTPDLSTQVSSGVIPGPSNPVAATPAAPQVRPAPVTRRTPFRPPLQVPSTAAQKTQAAPAKMRPKQKIFRPPAPLCPIP
ncbi:vegetative cell wall protein gp1-like [Arachis ipaensis]|uniref:vegetative cell wall protein gp1-like n=1 Tax=Arachis ipaensis TaxID=130454 RepID=UPI000A2B2768|nr:vegetative cell wall protein gp1-like [Arachis ipaensis]